MKQKNLKGKAKKYLCVVVAAFKQMFAEGNPFSKSLA